MEDNNNYNNQSNYNGAPVYNAPPPPQNYGGGYNSNNNEQLAPVLSIGEWMVTLIVLAIPVVGIVMYFVWAFGDSTNPSKKNFCRAGLIFALIGIVLSIIFATTCGIITASLMRDLRYY